MPERANLVARIPGRGGGPRLLLLMSHTDTVLADPAEWSVDPWSGELEDGHVWGRGALDMKGQVAASAVAIASLAREGFEPAGDLIFVAAADEEVGEGEQFGSPWLCRGASGGGRGRVLRQRGRRRPDRDRRERPLLLLDRGEDGRRRSRSTVRGRSGHGSMPGIADNALVKAAPLIERLGGFRAAARATARRSRRSSDASSARCRRPSKWSSSRPRAAARRGRDGRAAALDDRLADDDRGVAESGTSSRARARSRSTAASSRADDRRDAEPLIRETLGRRGLRAHLGPAVRRHPLRAEDAACGTRSAPWVEASEPGAKAAPVCVAGFTDSHWVREKFGTVAYGFFPARAMDPELAARLIHSADERVAVEDLELGLDFLRHAAVTIGSQA